MSAANIARAAPLVVDLGCWVCRVLADTVKAQIIDVALYEGMIVGARIGLGAPPILCASHAERWNRIGMDAGLVETFRAAGEHRAVGNVASPVYTRAELEAALEGLRVTMTDDVTSNVVGTIAGWLRARSRTERTENEDRADVFEELAGDLQDGEWRREPRP